MGFVERHLLHMDVIWIIMESNERKQVTAMYIADLHIHSRYSRATSRDCVPQSLDFWARRKGIRLIGTGDFTHPAWRDELSEQLVPAEEGLYMLRNDLQPKDATCPNGMVQPRFVVTGEISSIYKKDGRVRKVHSLILLPSLEAAQTLSRKLEAIGNIRSDGRPILGLDCRDLLEITLESCPEAIFIPAHIWTPHFSLFGAFSGFDTIEECFGDMTPYIHALETGLSSDPPMNHRLSALDGYTLVSNSDAHSPAKLGREANLLDVPLSYPALFSAIQTGKGFHGTIEFFPEEGKYHYDGHRNCGLCIEPAQTQAYGGKCPVCGRKLTIGVQHRVEELSNRPEGYTPAGSKPFERLVPLPEVIAASTGMSVGGKKLAAVYESMLGALGAEFYILREAPLDAIEKAGGPCVAEGIRRLRGGQVQRSPGYDGVYGTIQLLTPSEIEAFNGQISLIAVQTPQKRKTAQKASIQVAKPSKTQTILPSQLDLLDELNPKQLQAANSSQRAIAAVAGPGTGKTKTLVARIVHLIRERGVKPGEITAVTFTNKAATELRERLEQALGGKRAIRSITIGTFHSICLDLLRHAGVSSTLADEYDALDIAAETIAALDLKITPSKLVEAVSQHKNGLPDALDDDAFDNYCARLREKNMLDYDDLLLRALELAQAAHRQPRCFTHLLVDEFQDMNALQYRLVCSWNRNGAGLFVIGDPDQSIYGFRGSDAQCFQHLSDDFPALEIVRLTQNYRCAAQILHCALPVIDKNAGEPRILEPMRQESGQVRLLKAESELAQGIFVAKEISRLTGGVDMLDAQSYGADTLHSFSDIAVLYRTHRQADLLEFCLHKEGIPYTVTGRDDFLADPAIRGMTAFFRFLMTPSDTAALQLCLRNILGCPPDVLERLCHVCSTSAVPLDDLSYIPHILEPWTHLAAVQRLLALIKVFQSQLCKGKPDELLMQFAQQTSLSDSDAVRRLCNTAVFYPTMEAFLYDLSLGKESDLVRGTGKTYHAGTVRLMTLHGCKGLEFPVVFLCGIDAGRIPLQSAKYAADPAEERRLFYVGMTRAQESLYLLSSGEPSPFLSDVPIACEPISERKQRLRQMSLFD